MEITMTDNYMNAKDMVAAIKGIASDTKLHIDELRELDAVTGDGDLGITIDLGCNSIASSIDSFAEDDIGKLLGKCALNINKVCPSTFGTLVASALLSAGQATRGKSSIDINDLVQMGYAAIDGIKKRGKAEVGDKTMLDSLVPSVTEFERLIKEGNISQAFSGAALAAKSGMEATKNMKAKFGRAAWRQDGSIGMRDPGATAMYYLIESATIRFKKYFQG